MASSFVIDLAVVDTHHKVWCNLGLFGLPILIPGECVLAHGVLSGWRQVAASAVNSAIIKSEKHGMLCPDLGGSHHLTQTISLGVFGAALGEWMPHGQLVLRRFWVRRLARR